LVVLAAFLWPLADPHDFGRIPLDELSAVIRHRIPAGGYRRQEPLAADSEPLAELAVHREEFLGKPNPAAAEPVSVGRERQGLRGGAAVLERRGRAVVPQDENQHGRFQEDVRVRDLEQRPRALQGPRVHNAVHRGLKDAHQKLHQAPVGLPFGEDLHRELQALDRRPSDLLQKTSVFDYDKLPRLGVHP